eukprot:TRINITY_DN7826_c0_g1_i4.p1 TRINITY_DN7826_c0_g1~~TRINITY_DN7826_c0_g1_i4.p1  ORF type:complete len:388 (+),score=124.24 TRINITY_DN7826_c0_g1_i4:171-1334(+)
MDTGIVDPNIGWAGARLSYRTALGTPSERAKYISDEVQCAQAETQRIQDSLETMRIQNQKLINENNAVKEVNAKLRDMVETRVPYVATPPAPLPAQPYGASLGWGHGWGYNYPSWHWSGVPDGVSPAIRIKSGVVEAAGFPGAVYGELSEEQKAAHEEFLARRQEIVKADMEKMGCNWPAASWARFGHYCFGYGREFATEEEVKQHEEEMRENEAEMKQEMERMGDAWPGYSWARFGYPGWWHGCAWNTSYAKYYQDQLASHSEYEHKKYLEKREEMIAKAEQKQQELLQKEADLTAAEEQHEQFLIERRKLLQESENAHRRDTMNRYPSEYMYGLAHQVPRAGAPVGELEDTLLNKHRLERYKQSYLEDVLMLEEYHTKYSKEYSN